jgi:hypothetical protein
MTFPTVAEKGRREIEMGNSCFKCGSQIEGSMGMKCERCGDWLCYTCAEKLVSVHGFGQLTHGDCGGVFKSGWG